VGELQQHVTEVRKIRLILGWSQLKLAKEIGVSQSVISCVEKGIVEPSKKFAKMLDNLKLKYKLKEVKW